MAMADNLWRECAAWLTRCKVIPADHKANWPDSEIRVLALTLRDGVLLCNLLTFLEPNCLDTRDFHRKPQMAQFLCSQNIKLFLETCKAHFGIKDADLFEPAMLYDLTNFRGVLITLSKLSLCRRVQQLHPNIPGFHAQLSPNERSHSDEAIYRDLHSTPSSSSLPQESSSNHKPAPPEESNEQTVENQTTPKSGSLSVDEENSDVTTTENGTDTGDETDENKSSSVHSNNETPVGNSSNLQATTITTTTLSIIHGDSPEELTCTCHKKEQEKVYERLCYPKIKKDELTSSSGLEQRDYVIRELIDTESNYIDVLKSLREKFMMPMKSHLSREEINIIFPKINELAEIHPQFLLKLREADLPHTKLKLSQVFLDFQEPFLIYGEYCSSLSNATETLMELCKKNSRMDQLVQQCEKEYNVGKLQLRDILSVPMQRILKYHLLLDKLVKETSTHHEDYRGLERAKDAMIDVAKYINEVKRDSDHLVIIQKVKDSIVDLQLPNGNDLQQYGHLLLDGELHIKAHEDQKTKQRYAFIFEKIMILVKPLNGKSNDVQYTFRESHNLAEYRVENGHSRRTLGRDSRFKYPLILARKSQKAAFTLYLKTEPERDKWRKALNEAMENLDPPGCRNTDHKFEIHTFTVPIRCQHCTKYLKGRIHQGYRCKVCDIAVDKGCISSTGRCRPNSVSLPPPVCDRQLSEFYWFAGTMDRETAAAKLENRKIGTYLLRVRPQGASNPNETMYALSLKTDDRVIKHMKINQKRDSESVVYCLSTRRHFRTIVELVSYYERNDLGENFAGLTQTLKWPYREVIATAIYDFEPKGNNQLPLRQGCQIIVIGKDGDSKGWWRGRSGDLVGYFPKEYVFEHVQNNEHL
ncbi:protein vav isoform X1 [Hermetia illucens]|uniref:protein vav isoform X1 n=1 Tax=Hermetia illucens TaxID=343691 RepID=UPI0018CC6891|nr:protein vav isoform X1 [Hermetia illucens]